MRTAIYQGKHQIDLTEATKPKVGPNDVLIKNINASVCGSDIAVYQHGPGIGHKITVGEPFGHEMVSQVAEVGSEVTDFKVGQRVYPYPVFAAGDPHKAGELGGFTEYLLIKNTKLNHDLYLVPEELSNEVAALTEPFTVATRAVKRSHPQQGENACVFGAGTIGMAAAFALRHLGCAKVMVVDRSDYRLNLAKKFGLPEILQDYLDSQVIDSRFVMVGVDNHPKEINHLPMTFASQELIGSGGYRPDDVATVFDIFKNNQDQVAQMVTKVYPWEQLTEAIETASDPMKVMNIQVKY